MEMKYQPTVCKKSEKIIENKRKIFGSTNTDNKENLDSSESVHVRLHKKHQEKLVK
jgi:hypothetical protein